MSTGAFDLGDEPTIAPPTLAEQEQARIALGVTFNFESGLNRIRQGRDWVVTVDPATDIFTTANTHDLTTFPDGCYVTSTGTLPSPLVAGTRYFVRDVTATTFKLAATSGGAAINITTAGTGVISVQRNYFGAGGQQSVILGNGNSLNSIALYGHHSLIAGYNNTTANLGPTYFLGANNTVTGNGGFGVAGAIGSGNTVKPNSGGITFAIGDIHTINGNCNVGIGYHNNIQDDPQGCLAIGAGCYGYWQGTIHQVSHATAGDVGQAMGTLRAITGNHAGGDVYVPVTTSYFRASQHLWLKSRKMYNFQIDGFVGTSAFNSSEFMSFARRLVVRMRVYNLGNLAANVSSVSGSTITADAHGFVTSNTLYVTSTNQLPSPLLPNVAYYVVNPTTNTLQLSLTNNGTPITLTDTGSGQITIAANPPPEIIAHTAIAPDVGSNAGVLPSGWSYRIVPYNMVITGGTGFRMPDGTDYNGVKPTSLPMIRLYATLPSNATGYMCAARFNAIEGLAF